MSAHVVTVKFEVTEEEAYNLIRRIVSTLQPPEDQLQRVLVAVENALKPKCVICGDPISQELGGCLPGPRGCRWR